MEKMRLIVKQNNISELYGINTLNNKSNPEIDCYEKYVKLSQVL